MSGKHLMSDFKIEAAKAAPAVGGTVFAAASDNVETVAASLTWSEIAAIATVLYIALQAAYLVYKWIKEIRSGT